MAAFSGKSGTAAVGGVTMLAKQWNLNQMTGAPDVTNFGSSGWKEVVAGIRSYTVSISGFVDGSTSPTNPTAPGTFSLFDGTSTYAGTMQVTSITIDTDVANAVTFTLTGDGSGALTVT